jgi:hypothetical protein
LCNVTRTLQAQEAERIQRAAAAVREHTPSFTPTTHASLYGGGGGDDGDTSMDGTNADYG